MPTTNVDARFVALATRCHSLRVELDRLDDTVALLDCDDRARLGLLAANVRASADELEQRVERRAAGLR
jgi:hypothetical protein